jgi:hypothetical protein
MREPNPKQEGERHLKGAELLIAGVMSGKGHCGRQAE